MMILLKRNKLLILLYIGILVCPFCANSLWAKEFVVVIDAGHGGRDPGAIGKISKEKEINLKVALKLGNLIKKNCPDVKVVYTRTKDVFVALDKRAEIANDAKADLFISVHTNSIPKSKTIKGASTWTLGLARSQANLEVAKRENAVILYESDYKTRYAGFDPNSSESYIIFEFMQDKYMEQSVRLASLIQKQFKNTCNRVDRGVNQAEFLVLRATAMPSVLIELGFISTPEEERYLNTEEGANTMATGIFKAFMQYKTAHDNRMATVGGSSKPKTTPRTVDVDLPLEPLQSASEAKGEIVFMVQITTWASLLNPGDRKFKGLKGVGHYKENGMYKYTYGASVDYNEVVRTRRGVLDKFKDAFIIAFKDGEKMDVNEAIREFKKTKRK